MFCHCGWYGKHGFMVLNIETRMIHGARSPRLQQRQTTELLRNVSSQETQDIKLTWQHTSTIARLVTVSIAGNTPEYNIPCRTAYVQPRFRPAGCSISTFFFFPQSRHESRRCPHPNAKHYCHGKCKVCYMKVGPLAQEAGAT